MQRNKSAATASIKITRIHPNLNEGDIVTVFSQYGKVLEIAISDDERLHSSKTAFLTYESPDSAVLAVDNFNGIELLKQRIYVCHVT